ncbi:hypothetical protein R3P38DRAFT_1204539 [Favolaschia claudopus]|uniref:Uncharacterized protein n=1 Tax=Favolaschia claudopus TaxID=2862362 RepID=A0AAW0B469_9AGAR
MYPSPALACWLRNNNSWSHRKALWSVFECPDRLIIESIRFPPTLFSSCPTLCLRYISACRPQPPALSLRISKHSLQRALHCNNRKAEYFACHDVHYLNSSQTAAANYTLSYCPLSLLGKEYQVYVEGLPSCMTSMLLTIRRARRLKDRPPDSAANLHLLSPPFIIFTQISRRMKSMRRESLSRLETSKSPSHFELLRSHNVVPR